MHTHAPPGYDCPFCAIVAGGTTPISDQRDVVARTSSATSTTGTPGATALMCARWWPNNPGHVLVVPNRHSENLYELPAADGHAVHDLVRTIAIAIRETYGCDGISTRQHNEPAGDQDTWHYHVHVFPRYHGDDLYGSRPISDHVPQEARLPYAERLRTYLGRTT